MTSEEIFLTYTAQTSPHPLLLDVKRAEGSYIYTNDGKSYLDFISGISVTNVGHRHPKVLESIQQQLEKHLHVMAYGEYIQDPVNALARRLATLLPEALNCTYFVNSGTEANEAAIKLARRHTRRTEIVAFEQSYHGNTLGSLSVSGNESKKNAFRPLLPDVRFLKYDNERDLESISERTAGVLVEPIQGDAGVQIPSPDFLTKLRAKCTETGSLLIFDEVQTGFGRTGKLFAFEHFDVVPDILTLAKAMGGGLPIGAVVSDKEVLLDFTRDPALGHITTFGGNPVCAAAAMGVLDVLCEDGFLADVERKGKILEEILSSPRIEEIRRMGLMLAVQFPDATLVEKIVDACLEEGVITYFFLSNRHCFRLAPPLTISEDEIALGCKTINKVIDRV